jgi:hypothetical protein
MVGFRRVRLARPYNTGMPAWPFETEGSVCYLVASPATRDATMPAA